MKLGATAVVNYRDADVFDKLRDLGPYKHLFTASGDAASQEALAALAPSGSKFASVLPSAVKLPSNVDIIYTAFSQAAQKEEYAEWRDWWYQEYLPKVLSEGLVEPVKYSKVEGGLSALQQASQDVFDGKFKGKLVVDPQE